MKKFALLLLSALALYVTKAQVIGSGSALDFNGTSDYVSVDHDTSLNATKSISIEAWIKAESWHKAQWGNVIVSKDGWQSGDAGYSLRAGDKGILSFNLGNGGSGGWTEITTGQVMNLGQWYHVAGTWDGSTMRIYINGVEQNSQGYTDTIAKTTYDLNIGRITYTAGGTRNFDGEIDEVRVWKKALSETEIRTWMCKRLNNSHSKYSNLMAYYRFDEGTGTTTADSSGSGHTGTLNGTSWSTSGAAIGDESVYDYTGTIEPQYNHTDGSVFKAVKFNGKPEGAQIYIVNDTANVTSNNLDGKIDWSRYYGVFVVGGTNPNYTVFYDYTGNNALDKLPNEQDIVIGYRKNNAAKSWLALTHNFDVDTSFDQVEKCGMPVHREYIGGTDSLPDNVSKYSICEGDSIRINGEWRKTTKDYIDTYKSSLGCDSIVVSSLTVHPNYRITPPVIEICQGDSALIFTTYQKKSGKYASRLSTQAGCDSFVIQELLVHKAYNTYLPDIGICKGDSALIFGVYRSQPGTYTLSLSTVMGCDSTVLQPLVYSNEYDIKLPDLRICKGDSVLILGTYENQAGVYSETYTAVSGCDSVVTQSLFVDPVYDYSLPNVGVCDGDSVFMFGEFRSAAGVYTGNFKTVRGCDSIVTQELEVHKNYDTTIAAVEICNGDSMLILGTYQSIAGTYSVTYNSINGCDSMVSQLLSVVTIDTSITVASNGTLTATATGVSYQWYDCNTGNDISGETGQSYLPMLTGSYGVILDDGNCADTSECYLVDVTSSEEFKVGTGIKLFPNPVNSELQIEFRIDYSNVEWSILDLTGRTLLDGNTQGARVSNIDVSLLSSGTYMIKLKMNNQQTMAVFEKLP
jgi:hypothetical protein